MRASGIHFEHAELYIAHLTEDVKSSAEYGYGLERIQNWKRKFEIHQFTDGI